MAEKKMFKVHLPKSRYETHRFVGVNGAFYQVKRGVDVEVPEAVYEVLRNSEQQMEAAEDKIEAFARNKEGSIWPTL